MKKEYKFRKIKKNRDIPIGSKFVRIFYPVENTLDKHIHKYFQGLFKLDTVTPFAILLPDFHLEKNNVIGSVIPSKDTILLNEIGGDIGCGMTYFPLNIKKGAILSHLPAILKDLQPVVPVGSFKTIHIPEHVKNNPIFQNEFKASISSKAFIKKLKQQLGSLGGGNHFLEIQVDDNNNTDIMIHTDSRILGTSIWNYYTKIFNSTFSLLKKKSKDSPRLRCRAELFA